MYGKKVASYPIIFSRKNAKNGIKGQNSSTSIIYDDQNKTAILKIKIPSTVEINDTESYLQMYDL